MFWLQFSIEFCSHLSYSEPCGRRFFKKLPVYPLYPSGWILDKEIKNIHVCNILLQNVDSYSVEGFVFITCRGSSFCPHEAWSALRAPSCPHFQTQIQRCHVFLSMWQSLRSRGTMCFWQCGTTFSFSPIPAFGRGRFWDFQVAFPSFFPLAWRWSLRADVLQ